MTSCRAQSWCLAALALSATILGAASPVAAQSEVIKIVSSLPRTGSARAQTDTIVNGMRLAFDEAGNRVGNYRIVYEDLDDATAAAGQWTAERETANANRAVADPDVMIYLGTYNSGAAKISMPILNGAGLLMLSPAASWPGLTKPGIGDPDEPDVYRKPSKGKVTFFRVVPTDDRQSGLGAQWAMDLGFRTVYVLDDNEVYGKGIATLFRENCPEFGIKVLGYESIDTKALEFRALMARIKQKNPDLVYFGGSTQSKGGQIAKDLVAAGLRARLMVPDACYEKAFIESAGAESVNDRCYVTFGGLPPSALTGAGKRFVDEYRRRFGGEPEGYAVYGYEAAKAALEAIGRAGKKDRAAILEACRGIKDFDKGALGKWSFDANGDTTLNTFSGSRVTKGDFEFVKVLRELPPSELKRAPISIEAGPSAPLWQILINLCVIGLANGALIALVALGYTMVYGIVELINFAHGDLFMLGACLALSLAGWLGLEGAGPLLTSLGIALLLVVVPTFCAGVNLAVDRVIYRPLRTAPKLAPLVSAIGVSYVFQNIGMFWQGAYERNFPSLVSGGNLLESLQSDPWLRITLKDLLLFAVTVPVMIGLALLVKRTKLGTAMRATAQNPVAARLMGIDVDRVIGATFAIGGALAGVAAVVYCLFINTFSYLMGYTNGLYAFTAAVLGGIGNIPGAVVGGLVIGLVRSVGSELVGERWTSALVFVILIVILVFRPTGLLGSRTSEKV